MPLQLTNASIALAEQAPVCALRGTRTGGYPAHSHEFVELVLIMGGHGVHRSSHGPVVLGPGDVLLFRPGAWHAYEHCQALHMWDCSFLPALLDRELAWLMHHPGCAQLLWHGPLRDPAGFHHLRVQANALDACLPPLTRLRALHREDGDRRLAEIGTLIELLGVIAQHIDPPRRDRGMTALAQRAIEMMSADPAQAWHARGLARRLGVDPAYLSRSVHAATGLPPIAYLARLRAERAAALLVGSDQSIGAIAAAVGWHDPVRFARRFKAHFGSTASAYRARSRTGSAR